MSHEVLMAKNAKSNVTAAPAMDDKWQRESDHRTLMQAAEVMADPKRMAGVSSQQKKSEQATSMLSRMLANHKANGAFKRGGR
jgi:hypothetical protein